MKILFVVNTPEFFVSHRLPIAIAAQEAGFEIHIATNLSDSFSGFERLNFYFHNIPFSRSGTNPFKEAGLVWAIFKLVKTLEPDLLHLITIKPVIYGGIVARFVSVYGIVAAITGVGTSFIGSTKRSLFLRNLIQFLYSISLAHDNIRLIFQNEDDVRLFSSFVSLKKTKYTLIKGSGVSLVQFPFIPEPTGVPVITFASRLIKDKGVQEFIEAAKIIKEKKIPARFWLVGDIDHGNPTSISMDEFLIWRDQGIVETFGFQIDIAKIFSQSNLVVLPSYREGFPKVLIEAAASGRAVVTTNVPGCKDAIRPFETGLLVPPKDSASLAKAIEKLILDKEYRSLMGKNGRTMAEKEFGIKKVIGSHLKIYFELLK